MNQVLLENLIGDRVTALSQAVNYVNAHSMEFERDTVASQTISRSL